VVNVRFDILALIVSAIMVVGTVGYMQIEQMRLLDALYMTSITVTTVGFKEVHALSDAGKIFTIFLMFLGIGIVVYAIGVWSQYVVKPFARRSHSTLADPTMIEEEAGLADIFQIAGTRDKMLVGAHRITKASSMNGKSKADILQSRGILVMGIQTKDGNYRTDISFDQIINAGDELLVMGTAGQLNRMH